jgi:hypothetical protein
MLEPSTALSLFYRSPESSVSESYTLIAAAATKMRHHRISAPSGGVGPPVWRWGPSQNCAQFCARYPVVSVGMEELEGAGNPHKYWAIPLHTNPAKLLIPRAANLRDQGVGGSNPLSPTNICRILRNPVLKQ